MNKKHISDYADTCYKVNDMLNHKGFLHNIKTL